jgi:tRNA-specific adenosine deaminase 1
MKCLPLSKIQKSDGVGLHDWHAEILAIRTFNRFLLDECYSAIESGSSILLSLCADSDNLPERLDRPFQVKDNVKLHMYCSEAPCKFRQSIANGYLEANEFLKAVTRAWSL